MLRHGLHYSTESTSTKRRARAGHHRKAGHVPIQHNAACLSKTKGHFQVIFNKVPFSSAIAVKVEASLVEYFKASFCVTRIGTSPIEVNKLAPDLALIQLVKSTTTLFTN